MASSNARNLGNLLGTSETITATKLSTEVSESLGGGTDAYDSAATLPLTGNEVGDQAYVQATNRLYLWNGTGWYNIALINTAPEITSGGTGAYALAIDGTPTVITLEATDPEGIPINWSYSVTSGSLGTTATVSQADNVFTITPGTNDPVDAGTFELTFTASDGVNIATDVNSFTLAFEEPAVVFSPALADATTEWNLVTGASSYTITDTTERTITNNTSANIELQFDVQGAAGGGNTPQLGGRAIGTFTIPANSSIKMWVGANGNSMGGGGAASAIYSSSNADTAYIVAGGAGGGGGGRDASSNLTYNGGTGGGAAGNTGTENTGIAGGPATPGGGGTQTAGGSGGAGGRGDGQSGSFRQGGNGSGNSSSYAGGSGWAPGGDGRLLSGDGVQGGGGGGYYGGGGSGAASAGSGGGGGSGFIGNGATATSNTTGGAEQTSGKIVITVV